MSSGLFPTVTELKTVFVDEIDFAEGSLVDTVEYEDDFLVQRATLPYSRSVRGSELIAGGIAMRTRGDELLLHPYVQFHACGSGIVVAHTAESKRFRRVDFMDDPARAEDVMLGLRAAIHCCAQSCVLDGVLSRLRESTCIEVEASQLTSFVKPLGEPSPELGAQTIRMIASRFTIDEDPSIYGAIKAISSVARDLTDPEARWVLEETCGNILNSLSLAPTQREDGVRDETTQAKI